MQAHAPCRRASERRRYRAERRFAGETIAASQNGALTRTMLGRGGAAERPFASYISCSRTVEGGG
jgi:hypothetical protein